MLTYCNPLIHTTCALREYATVQKFALHNQYLQLLEKWYFVFRPRNFALHTAQKMRFFIKDFFSKCDQIRRKMRIWSHLLKKSLMENYIFFTVD